MGWSSLSSSPVLSRGLAAVVTSSIDNWSGPGRFTHGGETCLLLSRCKGSNVYKHSAMRAHGHVIFRRRLAVKI